MIHNVVDSSKLAAISHLLIGMWLCSGSFEAYIVVHYIRTWACGNGMAGMAMRVLVFEGGKWRRLDSK